MYTRLGFFYIVLSQQKSGAAFQETHSRDGRLYFRDCS